MDCKVIFAFAAAIACALVFDYSVSSYQSLALLIFPVAFSLNKRDAAKVITLFYFVAALPAFWVAYSYSQNFPIALGQYLALAFLNAVVVGFAFIQRMIHISIALPLALLIVSIPPLAYINPLSVLPISGWIFAGFGTLGIVGLMCLIGVVTSAKRFGIPLFIVLSIPLSNIYAVTLDGGDTISAIDIVRPHDELLNNDVMRIAYRYEELDLINKHRADVVVLPESVFGVWNHTDGDILSGFDLSIYGGGRKYVTPKRYRNVVFDGKTGEIVYEQRNQPPVAPSSGVKAVPGIGEKKDTGISFLICYELTNSWIAHKAFSEQEKLVVWIANLSWFESQYLSDRLESVLQAWANLYGKEPHSAVMNHD